MKNDWSPQELARLFGRDQSRYASLSRRQMLGGTAALAGAMFAAPLMPRQSFAAVGGELNIMAWEGFDQATELAEWRKANNVHLNSSVITTQDDVQTKLLGSTPVPLDISEYAASYKNFYVDELKIVSPIDQEKIQNYNESDIFPEFYKQKWWYDHDEIWAVPFCFGFDTLIYNPKMMDEPKSTKDLLDPKLKGLITMVDDYTGTFPLAARLAGHGEKYPNLTKDELKETFEVLKQYGAQCRTFASSLGDVVSLFVSGDIAACFNASSTTCHETAKLGLKTAYTFPTEGGVLWCDAYFIPKVAQNRETALAYINEALSPKAQAALALDTASGIVNRKAVPLLDKSVRDIIDYNNLAEMMKRSRFEGLPPRKSDEFATLDDWLSAYASLKSGI
jgi:spermidine/putrescine transport system substrate-binding protein